MEWKVPLFDLHFEEEEKQAVIKVLDSKWISSGVQTLEFEKRFAEVTSAKYAVAVNSGTAALHLAVLGLGIGPSDEVIVPSLTFAATVNAIQYTGAKPVFADIISREDLSVSPEHVRMQINERTKALMVMHYGGYACNMDEIKKIASENKLSVIEDAAHATGAIYHGKSLGTLGDVGAFSFFSNKNITTAEGGMLVTDNKDIADQARLLRSHGMTSSSYDRAHGHATKYDIRQVGYNYRLDDIRASIGLIQLGRLSDDLEKRRILVAKYRELLGEIEEVILPFRHKADGSSNYIFPIVLNENCNIERDEFRRRLEEDYGIQTSVHYPAVHHFTQYAHPSISLPVTDYVCDHEITLPLYYKLTVEEVSYVCNSIKKIIKDYGAKK